MIDYYTRKIVKHILFWILYVFMLISCILMIIDMLGGKI